MTKFIFSANYTVYDKPKLLICVVVANSYIAAHNRIIEDDPIWRGKTARLLSMYSTDEPASIRFKAL